MRERRGPEGPGATMKGVKSWDAIVMGGGVIGLSLALGLRRRGFDILVVEKGEPGREASHAAAGMLAACDPGNPPALRELACASLRLYREFVHQLEDESGLSPDLRMDGILFLGRDGEQYPCAPLGRPEARQIRELEPALATDRGGVLVEGGSVDPRALVAALLKAAKHRGVDLASGSAVCAVEVTDGKASGVKTAKTTFRAPAVVNCAGAWAGQIDGVRPAPTRPVKGQMLAVVAPRRDLLRHVIDAPGAYLVPRSDGRVLVGATVEECGFDKRVEAEAVQRLRQAAIALVPELKQARLLEGWAGLRPGTPDALPVLGRGDIEGYFLATGHFRNGILLAPVTAAVMAEVMCGVRPEIDISPFSPARFH